MKPGPQSQATITSHNKQVTIAREPLHDMAWLAWFRNNLHKEFLSRPVPPTNYMGWGSVVSNRCAHGSPLTLLLL